MYAKVENGTVAQTLSRLPKTHTFSDGSKTGNFDAMPVATQVAEGYYPVIENRPTYDVQTQRLAVASDTINAEDVTRNYNAEDIPLSELKATKIAEVELLLSDKLALSQFTYDGETFNFHQQAADDATQLQTLLGIGFQFPIGFSWTKADGDEHPLNQVEFVNFANTLAGHKLGLIGTAKTHVATIKAFTTAAEVVAYDIEAGW